MGFASWLPGAVGPPAVAAVLAVLGGRWTDRSVAFVAGAVVTALGTVGLAVAGNVSVRTTLIAVLTLALATSLVVVHRIESPGGRWGKRLRSRFVMGVPWGTTLVVAFLLAVYLFVQGGLNNWYNPVTIPFRAWSYLYPLGVLTSGFAHAGVNHLVSNLAGTIVLGTLAEYAWGHFPHERGSGSFSGWRHNPWVRALVVFPGVTLGAGLATAALAMGPVIGFSGVVFAYAGFALTRYPLGTVVAGVGLGGVRLVYRALKQPIEVATPTASPPAPPGWAQIAIQGHALGLFLGILVGWYVFSQRSERPSALAVWTGVLLFGVQRGLWAVYWFGGGNEYILYRGPGIVLVALLGLLVTAALTASDGRPFGRFLDLEGADEDPPDAAPVQADGGEDADGGGWLSDDDEQFLEWLTWRRTAMGLLFFGLWLIAVPGIGSNVFTAERTDPPEGGVEVGDYTVFYAENVTNRMVAVINVSFFNQTTVVETSGVIVTNPDRRIWMRQVSKARLAFSGRTAVDVGGIGWRSTVVVVRRGWSATGGGTAYKVWLHPPDGGKRLAYRSEPATAEATVAGRNVSVVPARDRFEIRVTSNNTTLARAPIPDAGNVSRAGGLRFTNRDGTVYAVRNETRVRVASEETYN